jgi:hypothetical protein
VEVRRNRFYRPAIIFGREAYCGGRLTVAGGLTGLRWWVALQAEFCFYQSNDHSKDYGGCDAEHEHSIGCFNGFQQSPPGR